MKVFPSLVCVFAGSLAVSAAAQTPVASYNFNGNLNANQGGAPALGAINSGSYGMANVFAQNTSVYTTNGSELGSNNAGLSLDASSLLSSGSVYTMQMVISKSQPVNDSWLKVLDVSDRLADAGFYYSPPDQLEIYPTSSAGPNVLYNNFYDIVLAVNGTHEAVYLNGSFVFGDNSGTMDLNVADKKFNFFVDDSATGFNEYSNTTVSYIALFNSALTADQIERLPVKAVPEPAPLVALGVGALGLMLRRRSRR